MANFRGTNIPDNTLDALRAEDPGKYDRILAKLADAIEKMIVGLLMMQSLALLILAIKSPEAKNTVTVKRKKYPTYIAANGGLPQKRLIRIFLGRQNTLIHLILLTCSITGSL